MISSRLIISKVAGARSAALSFVQRKIGTAAKRKFTEVEIKVPWGKVAGKLWNPNDTQPILALHGWQDNAASFDKLVPLLPERTSVLAIDLPGHGLSSWLPDGMIYCRFAYIQVIHRIREHYGWEKIGLMGHSLGAMFSFTYSVLYPEDVKFVVSFDYYKYPFQTATVQAMYAAQELSSMLQLERSKHPPTSYTEEQTLAKLMESTDYSLDESAGRALMVRGVTKKKDGTVYLNRDPRVKFLHLTAPFTNEHMREKVKMIKCPYMILKAADWHYNEKKSIYLESLTEMTKSSPDLQFFKVPGKHHFHMTNPAPAAKLIIPFLDKYN